MLVKSTTTYSHKCTHTHTHGEVRGERERRRGKSENLVTELREGDRETEQN